jgi:hypothetical protein
VYRRAHIVQEAGERKSLGSAATANFLITFQNDYGKSVLCDSDRRSQSIWSGTYNYCVIFVCCSHHSALVLGAGTALVMAISSASL